MGERAFGTTRSVRADWLGGQRCDGDGMGRGQSRDWCWRLAVAAGCRVWVYTAASELRGSVESVWA